MPAKHTTNYLTSLICGHDARFVPPPTPGDIVLCRRCNSYKTVKGVIEEWTIRCVADSCRVARNYGADEARARQVASRHCIRYSHKVDILHGRKTVDRIDPINPPLPFYVEFHRNNPEHHSRLKTVRKAG